MTRIGTPTPSRSNKRRRNRRGEGAKLREEIVATATAILEETRTPAAVTLRAIAREIGISTTSIYDHFPDRDGLLAALADAAYRELAAATAKGRAEFTDPVDRLRAGCRAYLQFARERSHLYGLLFTTNALPAAPQGSRTPSDGAAFTEPGDPGATSFGALVQAITACVQAGASTSTDPFADATAVWVAIHGYATLSASVPNFPWPPENTTFDHLVLCLARIRPASP